MRTFLVAALLATGCMHGWSTTRWTWPAPTPTPPGVAQVPAPEPIAAVDPATLPADVLPIYVHGRGARVARGERDDAARWVSASLPAHLPMVTIAPFEGPADDWRAVLTCARAHVAGLPVVIVEQAPSREDHLLVIVGGRAADAGQTGMWGFASMGDRQVVDRGVGFVFSADVTEPRNGHICEAIVHEIGHLLGLGHVAPCDDIMSDNSICPRVVPRGGFLAETRPILDASLAKWRAAAGRSTLAVATLVPELSEISDVETNGWFRVWPMAIETSSPISTAVVRYVTPDGLRGEYHMMVEGTRASVRFPLSGRGAWKIVIEVRQVDGGIGRTPEYQGSIY